MKKEIRKLLKDLGNHLKNFNDMTINHRIKIEKLMNELVNIKNKIHGKAGN